MKKWLKNCMELLKNIVMIALFACVISLLALYIAELSSTWNREETEDGILERLHALVSDEEEDDRLPSAHYLLPETVVLKREDSATILKNWQGNTMEIYYAELSELLGASFADASAFVQQPPATGEALWKAVSSLDECIYIRYHSDLPYQVLLYFTSAFEGMAICTKDTSPIVLREMACYMEVNGDAHRYHVLLRSSDGTVYHKTELLESTDLYSYTVYEMEKIIETSNAFVPCEFSGDYDSKGKRLFSDTVTPVLLSGLTVSDLVFHTDPLMALTKDSPDINAVLKLFTYNPNKINRHDEVGGTIVYVESHGVLRVSPSSISYTAAQNGGISVSEMPTTEGIDLYDALLFSSRLFDGLREINDGYLGGDCRPILYSTEGGDGVITLRYRYYGDNFTIRGVDYDVVLVFDSDKLVSAEIDVLTAYEKSGTKTLYSGAWIAERFYKTLGTLISLNPVYDYEPAGTVSAEWIAVLAQSEVDP